jgi:hypothetical protein
MILTILKKKMMGCSESERREPTKVKTLKMMKRLITPGNMGKATSMPIINN